MIRVSKRRGGDQQAKISITSHELVGRHRTQASMAGRPADHNLRIRTAAHWPSTSIDLPIKWPFDAARDIHGMGPVVTIDALAASLFRDGARLSE